MPNLAALIAPLALLLPATPVDDGRPDDSRTSIEAGRLSAIDVESYINGSDTVRRWQTLDAIYEPPVIRQVRIERRLIIRVAPRPPVVRENLTAKLPQRAVPPKMVEKKVGKCLNIGDIVGVQPMRDNRLMLYMRDQRMIAANLEKACTARDFYSGFYIEQKKDGKLCSDRDKLQSRTGASCEVERMRQLVADNG